MILKYKYCTIYVQGYTSYYVSVHLTLDDLRPLTSL